MDDQRARIGLATPPHEGSFRQFVGDLRRAARILRGHPWIAAMEFGLLVLVAGLGSFGAAEPDSVAAGGASFLGAVVSLSLIGWYGAQRLAFRAVMLGEPMGIGQLPEMIKLQGWRFVKLGLTLAPAGAVVLAISVVTTEDLLGPNPEPSRLGEVLMTLVSVLLLMALTFVTPSLAFGTDRARTALSFGWQRLRHNLAAVKWHVVIPPVVFSSAGFTLWDADGATVQAAALVLGFLTVFARGATVAAWLRINDRELAVPGTDSRD